MRLLTGSLRAMRRLGRPTSGPEPGSPWRARWSRQGVRLAGAVLVVVVAALAVWLPRSGGGGAAARPATVPAAWTRPAVSPAGLAQGTGVQLRQVAITGNGGLIDLRYRSSTRTRPAPCTTRRRRRPWWTSRAAW